MNLFIRHSVTKHFSSSTWLVDSGASRHMTDEKREFVAYEDLSTPILLQCAEWTAVEGTKNRHSALFPREWSHRQAYGGVTCACARQETCVCSSVDGRSRFCSIKRD